MDESFNIDVFLDGTHLFHYQTLDPAVDSEWVDFWMSGDGDGADNVVVSNTIDVFCTNETCTLGHAGTEPTNPTTTTTTTTTTTPTTPTPVSVPIEMVALIGGVAVVLVVLVIFMKRR
ncbi:MAG: hypothetical protein AM324_011285 [Candidatus Thorarchaeota archaeon SMTZ1-83]|nr:MAG: hypothetical protein AM324_12615 [Candidatus Thorarchaeota archaeon SMTZ1-83]